MMARWLRGFGLILGLVAIGAGLVQAEPVVRGFGFGGGMAMAFFPDLSGVNVFLSENGMPEMAGVMFGAGGNGRGGVIGGPVAGGIGWGVVACSETEDRSAELVFGGGGFDLGLAIGGDASSVLTVGVVLGGGANVLTLTGPIVDEGEMAGQGILPEPTSRELVCGLAFVQPYVSLAAQLLPWMGFELRIGYVQPVFSVDFGDTLGIPAPSLSLSGASVSFGFTFGGIGSGVERSAPGADEQVTETSSGTFSVWPGTQLLIENVLGDIVVSSYSGGAQTDSIVVEWQAVRTASQRNINDLQALVDVSEDTATLKTVGTGQVDYVVRIPAGLDLHVTNGTGTVNVVGHQALTVIVENGLGELSVQQIQAASLIVAAGLGTIELRDVDVQMLVADVGLGDITLELPLSTSATVLAKSGIGDVSIDRFPGMTGGVRGFLGKSGFVTLGSGDRSIELRAGIGRINIQEADY